MLLNTPEPFGKLHSETVKPLTIITKHSILNVAAALDPPLVTEKQNQVSKRNHSQASLKKIALKNVATFTGKNLRRSLFHNKIAG